MKESEGCGSGRRARSRGGRDPVAAVPESGPRRDPGRTSGAGRNTRPARFARRGRGPGAGVAETTARPTTASRRRPAASATGALAPEARRAAGRGLRGLRRRRHPGRWPVSSISRTTSRQEAARSGRETRPFEIFGLRSKRRFTKERRVSATARRSARAASRAAPVSSSVSGCLSRSTSESRRCA